MVRPTDSYDASEGGFEAAVRPQVDTGDLSSDEEEAQTAEGAAGAVLRMYVPAAVCLLPAAACLRLALRRSVTRCSRLPSAHRS